MCEKKNPKLLGRYHDLMILLVGFVLTTIVGGYLANDWQADSADIQREFEHKRSEQLAASEVFEEVSRLMNKRFYRMQLVHWGINSNNVTPAELKKRRTISTKIMKEWNDHLIRNLALVQRYFGTEARKVMQDEIQTRFKELRKLINKKKDYNTREELMHWLNYHIDHFNIAMITAIQDEKVGAFLDEFKDLEN